ncbi:hypothetical protein FB45DRAFT_940922 [Roridomyces roridus]|uniref:Uncharacterized protein n=1 Tax=Roridomyces roridus TaxID=1738132 RepID=A0AAD7FA76_9AGAR|nr:hypothetical protein FB45DRAFT_940922 [Roridomyces roridus]
MDHQAAVMKRDEAIQERDVALRERKQALKRREEVLKEKEEALNERDEARKKRDEALTGRDEVLKMCDEMLKEARKRESREREEAAKERAEAAKERAEAAKEREELRKQVLAPQTDGIHVPVIPTPDTMSQWSYFPPCYHFLPAYWGPSRLEEPQPCSPGPSAPPHASSTRALCPNLPAPTSPSSSGTPKTVFRPYKRPKHTHQPTLEVHRLQAPPPSPSQRLAIKGPIPPAPVGFSDWNNFYKTTPNLIEFAKIQIKKAADKQVVFKYKCGHCIKKNLPCLHRVPELEDSGHHYCLGCLIGPSGVRCAPPSAKTVTKRDAYPFDEQCLQALASLHNAAVDRNKIPGKWMGPDESELSWPGSECNFIISIVGTA